MQEKFINIDEYIATYSKDVQEILEKIRETIKAIVPEAKETISYAIPTFKFYGKNLVHFASFKKHIGLYATASAHETFKVELSSYKHGKGSVQFPLNKPIPYDIIKRIVEFRRIEITRNNI